MPNFYKIQYDDAEGNTILCTIQQPGTLERSSTVLNIQGDVSVQFDDIDDPFVRIRSSVARIRLEADLNQTFDDLFTEIERQWIVLIYRNDTLYFRGWLSPDGIFEDYVNDAWLIELEARDGIGDLQNKSYVDSSGNLYEGQATLRQILLRCLERTGFSQFTRFQHRSANVSNFPVEMVTTFPSAADFFDQKVNQEVFITTDGTTAKSCQQVLEEVLGACNGHLYSWGGEWYVNWSLQHANPIVAGAFKYTKYEINGTQDSVVSEDVNQTIGSEIKNFAIFWAGGNQRIERQPSVGGTRIAYRYGAFASVNPNAELDNDGVTLSGWTIDRPADVILNGDGTIEVGNTGASLTTLTGNNSVESVPAGNVIELEVVGSTTGVDTYLQIAFTIVLADTTEQYIGDNGEWTTSNNAGPGNASPTRKVFYVNGLPGTFTISFTTPPTPVSAPVYVKVFSPQQLGGVGVLDVTLDAIRLKNRDANPAEGEEHNAERAANPSSFTQPTLEVTLGDYSGSAFTGTLYRNDGSTNTDEGYLRPTSAFAFPLYQCNVVDRLFLRSKPSRVFEGDIYGFIPYNSRVTIDGFPGVVWVVHGWSWDSLRNVTSLRLFQVHWDTDMLDDIDYEKIINYGNVIEPKIKG